MSSLIEIYFSILLKKNFTKFLQTPIFRPISRNINQQLNNKCEIQYGSIKKIKVITKTNFKTQVKDRRVGDPDELIAKIEKSKNILDWTPRNSSIEKIIIDAWEWYKRYNKI